MTNVSGTAATMGEQPSHFNDLKSDAEDHIGVHPALDSIIDGLLQLATLQANGDKTSAVLCGLAGNSSGGNVMNLLSYVIAHLGHPGSNLALTTDVPASRLRDIEYNTREFAKYLELYVPCEHVDEAVWDLNPTAL
jgi:hypothetical protein